MSSLFGPLSRPASLQAGEADIELKKDLLRVVLAKVIKRYGIPAPWISGEINAMILPTGEPFIEVRLSLQVDEPRFLTYLSSFQAEFVRRLLDIAPNAREWLSRVSWTVTPDPLFESPLPSPEYWAHVTADRELTARQKGAIEWDRDALERHFVDTDPGEVVVDFDDTNPPDRQIENLAPPTDGKEK